MKNRARAPRYSWRQIYRWTRPPAPKPVEPPPALECSATRHVWVSKADEPQPDERCLCGKHVYGVGQ